MTPDPVSLSKAALELAKAIEAARGSRDEARVLRAHLEAIDRLTQPVLGENRELRSEVNRLRELTKSLAGELQAKASGEDFLEAQPFRVLCAIYDNGGAMIENDICAKLSLNEPDLNWCLTTLYRNCLISPPGDGLDDTPNEWRIISDGTAYLHRFRAEREVE